MVIVFDLDDTLYDEVDFVRSGFSEISQFLKDKKYFDFMWNEFCQNGSGKVFDKLINKFNLSISLQKLIEIYRFHRPDIRLPKESVELLKFSKKYQTALISDGHYIMQQNKFYALKLEKFIKFALFTDYYHTQKPELKPFKIVMQKYSDEKDFIYISDNPKKDFIAPNKLGWKSIRYKNSNGIYKDCKNSANFEVKNRSKIIDILKELDG